MSSYPKKTTHSVMELDRKTPEMLDKEKFDNVVHLRQVDIWITYISILFLFIGAILSMMLAWHLRNLRVCQLTEIRRYKSMTLFVGIFLAVVTGFAIITLVLRLFLRSRASTFALSVFLVVLVALTGLSSVLWFLVYKSFDGAGGVRSDKTSKYLTVLAISSTLILVGVLVVLFFTTGFTHKVNVDKAGRESDYYPAPAKNYKLK
jgi:hypothetical protein